jgi:hypothetical protein
MTDKFADLEAPKSRVTSALLALFVAFGLFLFFRWSGSTSLPVTGVVESTGTISVAKIQGGTRKQASVRLEDGRLVFAYVVSGGPLAEGDRVRLVEQRRPLGGPVYQVVANQH